MDIISGKAIADEIKAGLQLQNSKAGISPCLAVIDIGDNKENALYIKLKEAAVKSIGGITRMISMDSQVSAAAVLQQIEELNLNPAVDGILLQLPVPLGLERYQEDFLKAIAPHKDVDGFCPHNRGLLMGKQTGFISCAALACMEVCSRYMSPLAGKRVLLVGDSFDVIQPLALMFIKAACDIVIIPYYRPGAAQDADIAVIEKGKPLEVTGDGIKPGTLLIDAGFHWHQERVCGNIDREDLAGVEGYLLPVPGGMGPLLIAQLMVNLTQAAHQR